MKDQGTLHSLTTNRRVRESHGAILGRSFPCLTSKNQTRQKSMRQSEKQQGFSESRLDQAQIRATGRWLILYAAYAPVTSQVSVHRKV